MNAPIDRNTDAYREYVRRLAQAKRPPARDRKQRDRDRPAPTSRPYPWPVDVEIHHD